MKKKTINTLKENLLRKMGEYPLRKVFLCYLIEHITANGNSEKLVEGTSSFSIEPREMYDFAQSSFNKAEDNHHLKKFSWLKKPLKISFRNFAGHMKEFLRVLEKTGAVKFEVEGKEYEALLTGQYNGVNSKMIFMLKLSCKKNSIAGKRERLIPIFAAFAIALLLVLFSANVLSGKILCRSLIDKGILTGCTEDGKELWQVDIDALLNTLYPGTENIAIYSEVDGKVDLKQLLSEDIDNDGKIETILSVSNTNWPNLNGTIMCFNERGKMIWNIRPWSEYSWVSKPDEVGDMEIRAVKLDDSNNKYIVTRATHYRYSPCQVCVIDKDGNKITEFWNAGHFMKPQFKDVDGDNKKEIFLAGTSNHYGCIVFCIIDPFINSIGSSPVESEWEKQYGKFLINGQKPDNKNCRLFMRLPRPDWLGLKADARINPNVFVLRDDCIELSGYPQPLERDNIDFFWRLNWDFSIQSFVASGDYHRAHNEAYDEGELPCSSRNPEFQNRMLQALYWSGEKWSTINE